MTFLRSQSSPVALDCPSWRSRGLSQTSWGAHSQLVKGSVIRGMVISSASLVALSLGQPALADPLLLENQLETENLSEHFLPEAFSPEFLVVSDFLIAAPENLSPSLQLPPPLPPTPPPPAIEESPAPTPDAPDTPRTRLESLEIDFRNQADNYGEQHRIIEPLTRWRLPDGNILTFKTGFNTFDQTGVPSVTNVPVQVGWEGQIGATRIQAAGGLDFFDRLPTALNFQTQAHMPITPSLTLSGIVEQQPYKFNARTLNNQITAWRYGPNLYWQIDPDTSFFSLFRWGNYNDGNSEKQSFSRLERKFGNFFVGANLFTWRYQNNVEVQTGYFSPPDFLVYHGEVGWDGDVFEFLRCRITANLGQQRLQGEWGRANSYEARCTARLAPNIEADLGYSISDVRRRDTGATAYSSDALTGKVRVNF